MDAIILSWIGIIVMFLFVAITLLVYAVHCGLWHDIVVSAGKPPVSNITFAYKFARGDYKNSGQFFTEACCVAPTLRTIGIYYDDPKTVPAEKLRYAVGSILSEGSEEPDPETVQAFTGSDFKIFSFPAAQNVVRTTFPFKGVVSVIIGLKKVYPKLTAYLEERRLIASPWFEIYMGDIIHYMAILDKNEVGDCLKEFFVPEAIAAAEEDKAAAAAAAASVSQADQ